MQVAVELGRLRRSQRTRSSFGREFIYTSAVLARKLHREQVFRHIGSDLVRVRFDHSGENCSFGIRRNGLGTHGSPTIIRYFQIPRPSSFPRKPPRVAVTQFR
jgi:hypothetical protein